MIKENYYFELEQSVLNISVHDEGHLTVTQTLRLC